MDQCWVHNYYPETKLQSKQWKHGNSPVPKKAKALPSSGKVILSVFWDCRGALLTDYSSKGQTITAKYYCELLTKLRGAIKEKRRRKLTKGVRLHHDNAPTHLAHVTAAHSGSLGYEILPYPPYSPDRPPSDFFHFPRMKSTVRGKHIRDDGEVITQVELFLNSQNEEFYRTGLRQLMHRWQKCVTLGGFYVERY
ncbi:histone-lysine N-methyltransferase SETMAR-like [Dermacentor silvarum]|uniref:histone-lysine N-methyltransferase SETMAR-like n=1 Tax=Dermacentor silvarum TaxID=543639 RepID=UPI002100DEE1|nr:histone-lysine N-methyltransferase SETMAR-like [Dermacentor silvarum]